MGRVGISPAPVASVAQSFHGGLRSAPLKEYSWLMPPSKEHLARAHLPNQEFQESEWRHNIHGIHNIIYCIYISIWMYMVSMVNYGHSLEGKLPQPQRLICSVGLENPESIDYKLYK